MSDNENWSETKKECELNDKGEYIVKKVYLEKSHLPSALLSRKDWIDYTFRILGLISIFTPLYLFYRQQEAEITKQERLKKVEIYSAAIVDLHAFFNAVPFTNDFETKANKIMSEDYPKIIFLNDKNLLREFTDLKTTIEFTNYIRTLFTRLDKTDKAMFELSTAEVDFNGYSKKFDSLKVGEDFYSFKRSAGKIKGYAANKDFQKNTLLKSTLPRVDSLVSHALDVIADMQSINLRDSIYPATFAFSDYPSVTGQYLAQDYIKKYNLYIARKTKIVDSIMIASISKSD